MKVYLSYIVVFALVINVFAKKHVDIEDIPEDVNYCQIIGTQIMTKVAVKIDFGEKTLAKKDGKYFSFNSMIDALNFMTKNGWEYIDSYTISLDNESVHYYLLKRKN